MKSKVLNLSQRFRGLSSLVALLGLGALTSVMGQDAEFATYEDFASSGGFALFTVNNLWILISAALVFLMHLGFATLESGMSQAKNTTNVLF